MPTWNRYPAVRIFANGGSCELISSSVRFRGASALRTISSASALGSSGTRKEITVGGRGQNVLIYRHFQSSWTIIGESDGRI